MANTLKFGNGEWYGKKDTILAYNDENSNYKPLPFNFSRASNATVINKDGLIEEVGSGEPRVDYKDDSKGALLLEPTRTNRIIYSNGFDNAAWEKGASGTATAPVVSANQGISPDGTNNAFKIDFNLNGGTSTSDRCRLTELFIGTITTDYTFTYWIKAFSASDVGKVLNFNVDNVTNFGSITVTENWQRLVFTGESIGTSINNHIQLRGSYGTSDSVSILLYGYQAEAGSYATSYIPTYGSTVTRLSETCSQTVPDGVIGQTEGTMFVDCKINAQGTYTGFSLSDGTTNNEVIVRFTTTDRIEYYLRSGGSQPFGGGTTAFDTDSRVKVAIAYKSGDSVFYVNGTEVASSTNTTIPLNLSKVKFSRGNSTADFSGITKNFKVYNTRLSNSELAALTQV